MKYGEHKNGFFLPNELFQLGLDYGELAVYSFLKRCEIRLVRIKFLSEQAN